MKKIYILVLLAVISVGCVDSDIKDRNGQTMNGLNVVDPTTNKYDKDGLLAKTDDVRQITLAQSLSHGVVNPEVMAQYADNETIEMFVRALHTAAQLPGILNTATPDYDIVLVSENKDKAFHLWINEASEQAMLMDVRETHTGYRLTKEATDELKKIIFAESSFKGLEFRVERNTNGDLVAKPRGLSENNYMLSGGPVIELRGSLYHTIH